MRAIKLSKLKELLDIHTRVYTNVPKEYLEIFDNFNMNLFLHLGNDIAIKSLITKFEVCYPYILPSNLCQTEHYEL